MKVFLSHSYDDLAFVQKLRSYLEMHDVEIFDEKKDITTGASLTSSINEAINSSDAVLFLISKNSDKSKWVHQEMSLAVSNRLRGSEVKLIPIVIEKNADIPFFLKDFLYLDASEESTFETSMSQLIHGLKTKKTTTVKQDTVAQAEKIEVERALLKLRSLEHEEHNKFKTRQMFFVSMIVTLISSIVVSVGLLGWVAKIEYQNFEWIIAFLAGAIASIFGSILYMKKEKPHKDELIRKVDELHELLQKMESRHDK